MLLRLRINQKMPFVKMGKLKDAHLVGFYEAM